MREEEWLKQKREKQEKIFQNANNLRIYLDRKNENKSHHIYKYLFCKDCGKEFEITMGECNFFLSNNLDLPKRCNKCRIIKDFTTPPKTPYH